MNTDSIYQFLENRNAYSADTEETLAAILEKYPWFSGGQLLNALLKKKKNSDDADQLLAKAQLYVSNPLWVNWQVVDLSPDAFPEPGFQKIDIEIKGEDTETALSFEPLHTIDYFASQGIRLRADQLGNDSFSKQVKTFTEWLQSMKKIYHTDNANLTKTADGNISKMADASNSSSDIITETMAEILIQQGKKQQAISIFEKLSLLHPEKSSYFTARISELKNK